METVRISVDEPPYLPSVIVRVGNMRELRVVSDLHLEISGRGVRRNDPLFELPISSSDSRRVLVLAGDIDVDMRASDLALRVCDHFRAVIQILGNHEYYKGGSPQRLPDKLRDRVSVAANVHILENEAVDIGDIRFIGATLWTDFRAANREAVWAARDQMNDFRRIRCGSRMAPYAYKFLPERARELHNISRHFIEESILSAHSAGQTPVVITHHAPYYPAGSDGPPLSFSYGSDLSDLILRHRPSLWIHGHTHDAVDTQIGSTHVVSNPRGYAGIEPVNEFNPSWIVAV